jgi:putative DNA primase/helicase
MIPAFRDAVLAATGGVPDIVEPGRLHRFSTNGKRGDTAGWCKLFDDGRAGVFGDWRSGIAETWTSVDRALMTRHERAVLARQVADATAERELAQRRAWAENADANARLWAQCLPLVPGDAVTQYLKRRGFAGVWPLPACLRYHPALDYWHEGECIGAFPTMVAPLTAPDGRIVAIHRTYLARDGRKANVPTVRKLTRAAGPLAGSFIPLFVSRHGAIGIAEGVETSLAAWLASGVPTVAAYCAGNLSAWQWPPAVRRIVIFADADRSGRDAAEALRVRVLRAGIRVKVAMPSKDGDDWADVWASRAGVTT